MNYKKVFIILCMVTITLIFPANTSFSEISQAQSHEIKLLVIVFDPILEIRNNMRYHEYTHFDDPKVVVDELIEDFRDSSGGLINYKIADWQLLDEYVPASGGRFTDETYVDTFEKACAEGAWWAYKGWEGKTSGFDYVQYLDKYDIVNRVNKGEIDEVWICPTEPGSLFESILVGRNAFWINGTPIERDCKPFAMMNISYFRRDANIECFGHRTELVMNAIFKGRYNDGWPGGKKLDVPLDELNSWERFTLNEVTAPGNACVGNMHFAPNSQSDYDWGNTMPVYSSWKDWRDNFPNLKGERTLVDSNDWGKGILRLHHKWWYSLFPRLSGRDKDSFDMNWWNYFATSNFVRKLKFNVLSNSYEHGELELYPGLKIPFTITGTYNDDTKKDITPDVLLKSSDNNVVSISGTNLITGIKGSAKITARVDGREAVLLLTVGEKTPDSLELNIKGGDTENNEVYLAGNSKVSYSVKGTYLSGMMEDITSKGTLKSSNRSVIEVENGKLSVLKPGTSVITVSLGKKKKSITVNVYDPSKAKATVLSPIYSSLGSSGTSFEINKRIVVAFNKDIQEGAKFNGIMLKDSRNNTIKMKVSIKNNKLYLAPDEMLRLSSDYSVLIPPNALKASMTSLASKLVTIGNGSVSLKFKTASRDKTSIVQNGNFEVSDGNKPYFWYADGFERSFSSKVESGVGLDNSKCISLTCSGGNDVQWIQKVSLTPGEEYLLSGYIKGENIISPDKATIGAGLCVMGTWDHTPEEGSTGTFDWKKVSIKFIAPATGEVEIGCRLGYWGSLMKGKAFFDNITITKVD